MTARFPPTSTSKASARSFAPRPSPRWSWSWTTGAGRNDLRLRSGTALGRDREEVAVRFRPVPHLPFGHSGEARPNLLRFGLDPETLTLELTGSGGGAPFTLAPMAP